MSKETYSCIIFVGPTLTSLNSINELISKNIQILPPVKRGDIEKVVEEYSSSTSTIAIVDGVFHQFLSVSHAEIRLALSKGWTVWGLSSMGAIRAYEMRSLGMRGFGYVYEQFCIHEDFRDDEVALIHESEFPYRGLSEPLIHIRVGLQELLTQEYISDVEYERVLKSLMETWFGNRSLPFLRSLLIDLKPDDSNYIDQWLSRFEHFRVKNKDFHKFIMEKPWETI